MTKQLVSVGIDDLVRSDSNVREKHSKDAITVMANSIQHRGIINPPSVVRNGEGWQVIAGNLRVEGARAAGLGSIMCVDCTDLDETQRIELSLAENIDRKQMTAIELFRAMTKLYDAGVPVHSIASKFTMKEIEVRRHLAIGDLPKKLLDLAEKGEVDQETLPLFAVAPRSLVNKFLKLPKKDRPTRWGIRKFLEDDSGWYAEKFAIFDLEEYDGPRNVDLFDEDQTVWLQDGNQFWLLQHAAIEKKKAEFVERGWPIEEVEYFEGWAYKKTAKKDGGKVVIECRERTGEVNFHVGYARPAKAGKAPAAGNKAGEKEQPEISQELARFVQQYKHAQVCEVLTGNKDLTEAVLIALILKNTDNLHFRYEPSGLKNEGLESLLQESSHMKNVRAARDKAYELLGYDTNDPLAHSAADHFKRVMLLTKAQRARCLSALLAAEWAVGGGALSNAVGMELEQAPQWPNDDRFWDRITNKKVLMQFAKENKIGKDKIDDSMTAKGMREVIKRNLEGLWAPKWFREWDK